MSTISVVIPAFNQAHFIGDALASVLTQTRRALEIIVVDDGSTDATPACVRAFGREVCYVRQENKGLAAARNTGFHSSRGDYVLFLDGDDVLHPEMLGQLAAKLDSQRHIGLAYCGWEQVTEDGSKVLGVVRPGREGILLEDLLLRRVFFFPSCALIRRAAIEDVGIFDASLLWSEDADLWLRLASADFQFGYVDRLLVRYRVHPTSMTSRVDARQVADSFKVLDRFLATPGLSTTIRRLESVARSTLHFEAAGRYLRAGYSAEARQHLQAAMPTGTPHDHDWILQWIAGTALDPRTPDPEGFVVQAADALRDLAPHWTGIERDAQGHCHIAAAFTAHANHDAGRVVRHAMSAVFSRPTVLLNRGFLRIGVSSLTQMLLTTLCRPARDQVIVVGHQVAREWSRP